MNAFPHTLKIFHKTNGAQHEDISKAKKYWNKYKKAKIHAND